MLCEVGVRARTVDERRENADERPTWVASNTWQRREFKIDAALAKRHYAEHEGKPFFNGLVDYITSSPVIDAVLEGPNAIQAVRNTVGATNPIEAAPGSIRADFGLERGRNLVHASDSPASGEREAALFFAPADIIAWTRDTDRWILE